MIFAVLAGAVAIAAPSAPPPSAAAMEQRILVALNTVRANPRAYATALAAYKRCFVGRIAYAPGDGEGVETEEGVSAVDEAMTYVADTAPKTPLTWDPSLAAVAARHAEDQKASGLVGHEGSDGASFEERMQPLRGREVLEEVISYGERETDGVVRQLIVDDGVQDRGHRSSVFDSAVRRAGVACRSHPVYGLSCVIDLSSQ